MVAIIETTNKGVKGRDENRKREMRGPKPLS